MIIIKSKKLKKFTSKMEVIGIVDTISVEHSKKEYSLKAYMDKKSEIWMEKITQCDISQDGDTLVYIAVRNPLTKKQIR